MGTTARTMASMNVIASTLTFATLASDVLTLICKTTNAAGAGPVVIPDEGQLLELFQDSDRRFRGTVTKVEPGAKTIIITAEGPWWWMEKVPLTGTFTDPNGVASTRTNFVRGTGGLQLSLEALINRMAAIGVPLNTGSISAMYQVMKQSFPDNSCATALADMLLWCPDAVPFFNYAGTTPVLNITRRGAMSRLTYTVGTHRFEDDKFAIHARTGLQVSRVELPYAARHATTGKVRYLQQADGTGATGKILRATISGPETVAVLPKSEFESYMLRTSPINFAGVKSFIEKNDGFVSQAKKQYVAIKGQTGVGQQAATVTVYVPSGTKRKAVTTNFPGITYQRDNGDFISAAGKHLVLTAKLPEWAIKKYGGVRVTVKGTWLTEWRESWAGTGGFTAAYKAMQGGATWTGKGYESSGGVHFMHWCARPFSATGYLVNTGFAKQKKVYKPWDYDFIQPPADLAANLRAAMAWVPYEGAFTLVGQEWPLVNLLNRKIAIGGSRSDFATMDALIRSMTYDLMGGRMTIDLGPPPRTDFGSLVNKIRRQPSDNIAYL